VRTCGSPYCSGAVSTLGVIIDSGASAMTAIFHLAVTAFNIGLLFKARKENFLVGNELEYSCWKWSPTSETKRCQQLPLQPDRRLYRW
jgi:hypothetical protein